MTPILRSLAGAALAVLAFPSCNYDNPHGSQALPPVVRLDTDPSGATVEIQSLGLQMETPCDLPETVETDDVLVIRHAGYVPWQGELQELPQRALGTYYLRMQPVR